MPKPRKIHEKNHETSALCNKYFRFGDHLYGVCQSPKKSIINKNCEYFYKNCNIKCLLQLIVRCNIFLITIFALNIMKKSSAVLFLFAKILYIQCEKI